jgi:HicB family
MDITPYVENLRRDLQAAAEAGGDHLRDAAERLTFALDPAARLMLMEAISQAAAEITTELPSGSVDVRLAGRELDFVVQVAPTMTTPAPPTPPTPPAPPTPDAADDGSLARITLRLPESVKARAEERASEAGQSLNTWLVSVVRAATNQSGDQAIRVDVDLSSIPFFGEDNPLKGRKKGRNNLTGWL